MEDKNKTTAENKDNKCTTCGGNGYVKTGYNDKPYILCKTCKGEPLEDLE